MKVIVNTRRHINNQMVFTFSYNIIILWIVSIFVGIEKDRKEMRLLSYYVLKDLYYISKDILELYLQKGERAIRKIYYLCMI